MDAVTAVVEFGVGVACVVMGAGVLRTRPAPGWRLLGALLLVAGIVAVGHAAASRG